MEGNQREIQKHKKDLIDWTGECCGALRHELSYQKFHTKINAELNNINKFSELRDREKEYNVKIKKVIEDQQSAIDSYTKDVDEFKTQITDKKDILNVTEVESKLKTQLLER